MERYWCIELLGALRAVRGERVIDRFHRQKNAALLAYLAFHLSRSHPRELLVDLFWPELEPEAGRHGLSMALSSLRRQFEPPGIPAGAVIRADRVSVQLNPKACTTDVRQFEGALERAAGTVSELECVQRLTEAVELYRGELLPGQYHEWLLPERERLTGLCLQALAQLVEHWERSGDPSRAIEYTRRALAVDPLQEEAHQRLIRLLAAAGQRSAALQQYVELERLLREELDTEPSADTRALAEALRSSAALAVRRGQPEGDLPVLPWGEARAVRRPEPAQDGRSGRPPTGIVAFLLVECTDAGAPPDPPGTASEDRPSWLQRRLCEDLRQRGGCTVREGEGWLLMVFERAQDALHGAIAGQQHRSLRMALHIGHGEVREGEYWSAGIDHVTRMLVTAHEGQILCSEVVASLLRREPESDIRLEDLGLHDLPGEELPERLFQVHHPSLGQREFPLPRAGAGFGKNLPLPLTRFFGREAEIARLAALLLGEDTRLVTLTGPGGSGKTRLALEVATRLAEPFRGAVWWVSLIDLRDPRLIFRAVARALGLPFSPESDPLDQVVSSLSQRPSLLALDNFEHLVGEGASAVRCLLERVPALTCLVTSRQVLALPGEQEFTVLPLPTPAPVSPLEGEGELILEQLFACPSVQLFVDRAQAVRPDFQVTPANVAAVAALSTRLEGLPLSLELAAARARILTPAQMLERLDHRFELLTTRQQLADARHQSLRATLDWSYRLLSPELQRFFARLSVFRGGWSLAAAEAVCRTCGALECLEQLREVSLILWTETYEGDRSHRQARFRMLETMREYAVEQCTPDERAEAARQHAAFYLALAERAERELTGPDQKGWLDELEAEHDNLRAALHWAIDSGDTETGLRLAAALGAFWNRRGHWTEGRAWLAKLLAQSETVSAWRARALHIAGVLAFHQTDFRGSVRLLQQAITMSRQVGDPGIVAASLETLGKIAWLRGLSATTRCLYAMSLRLRRDLRDRVVVADALACEADVAFGSGQYETARSVFEESLALHREVGNRSGIATVLMHSGRLAYYQGDPTRARSRLEEGLALQRELSDRAGMAISMDALGFLARDQGDHERARALHEEALAIQRQLASQRGIANSLGNLGAVARLQGDFGTAQSLQEQRLRIGRKVNEMEITTGAMIDLASLARDQGDLVRAEALLKELLGVARAAGSVPVTAEALNLLGQVHAAQNDLESARRCYEECLCVHRVRGDSGWIACMLDRLGGLALERGDYASARVLFEEQLQLARQMADRRGIAVGHSNLGRVAQAEGNDAEAERLLNEALRLQRERGHPWWEATVLGYLGSLARQRGDVGRARSFFESSLRMMRELDDRPDIAAALDRLGDLMREQGELSGARSCYAESLAIRCEKPYFPAIVSSLEAFAELARAEGEEKRATRLLGSAAALRERKGLLVAPLERCAYESRLANLRERLGAAGFNQIWDEGYGLSWEQAAAEALGEKQPAGK